MCTSTLEQFQRKYTFFHLDLHGMANGMLIFVEETLPWEFEVNG